MALPPVVSLPHQAVDELTPPSLLSAATTAVRARRLAEVDEPELAIQWAVLNGHPTDERDSMVTPGGDGTPELREYAVRSSPWRARPTPPPPVR